MSLTRDGALAPRNKIDPSFSFLKCFSFRSLSAPLIQHVSLDKTTAQVFIIQSLMEKGKKGY